MTSPEFSVLLLAWDDADPGVAVLGGAALPPTRSLVYQLAEQHPVLAFYPHLPTPETPAEASPRDEPTSAPNDAHAAATSPVAPDAPDQPGVRLLPAATLPPSAAKHLGAAPRSSMIGLSELETSRAPLPADGATLPLEGAPVPPPQRWELPPPALLGHNQWPAGAEPTAPDYHWQAPAEPYVGAGALSSYPAPVVYPAPPPVPAIVHVSLKGAQTPTTPPAQEPAAPPLSEQETASPVGAVELPASEPTASPPPATEPPATADTHDASATELATIQHPELLDEPTEEIGPAEANDMFAPEDDIVPDVLPTAVPVSPAVISAPAPAQPAATVAAAVATPAPVVVQPKLDGLNFRMIQYARRAAQLAQSRSEFGVIYAPNWPAWLAAQEIRNSSRMPLVLYVASLVADFTVPAERGWLQEVERMTLRRAHVILVPDEAIRRRLHLLYPDTTGKTRVVAADDEDTVQRVLGEVALY
ncbi:glycosyltransferase family 4 protein [Hymenobacter rubidus]|uniref:glycosyltransferase family 4 protein n=1 Tax=Hymenobacter rubidus TaxID=1441626 RepID=UPI00191F2430|nr:glycosyltransferase family 4 protein [Hymenobacter rubidus]